MNFSYHHFGVVSSDPDATTKMFCELLGHSVEGDEHFFSAEATMLTQQHCDLRLAVYAQEAAPDWLGGSCGVGYVAFAVNDLEATLAELQANGVEQLCESASNASYQYAAVASCEGLPVVLIQPTAPPSINDGNRAPDNEFGFRLTHTAVLTDDFPSSEQFWRDTFGLHRFSKNDCDGSGFLALSDNRWEPGNHTAFMEILCPPNVLNVDQRGYDLRGVSYYHLSYYSTDVAAAWQHLVDAGLFPTLPVYVEAGTGAEGSFVAGVDGIDIEVFGGGLADELIEHPNISEIDDVFSVSAAELAAASGEMATL